MGHKVNPVGMRIGINRAWNSRWYASDQDFSKYLNEDRLIRDYLKKATKGALLSHVEIERSKTDKGQRVNIFVHVARPAVVIGQDGKNVNEIKKTISKLINNDDIRVDCVEVKNPDLDAMIVATTMAEQLEARMSFRSVQKKAILKVRKAGAKGIKTSIGGRLGGADIARSEGYKEGIIPLHTLRSDIDFAHVGAATQYGQLGVKVWICRGEIRPELQKKMNKEAE